MKSVNFDVYICESVACHFACLQVALVLPVEKAWYGFTVSLFWARGQLHTLPLLCLGRVKGIQCGWRVLVWIGGSTFKQFWWCYWVAFFSFKKAHQKYQKSHSNSLMWTSFPEKGWHQMSWTLFTSINFKQKISSSLKSRKSRWGARLCGRTSILYTGCPRKSFTLIIPPSILGLY